MPVTLTIAGSDPSGGAGLQADLKTFQSCAVYGMSVVTVLTDCASSGVEQVHAVPKEFVTQQLVRVTTDFPPDAIKSGMLFNRDNVSVLADYLARRPTIPYVFDPVITTRRGERLVDDDTQDIMIDSLLPRCVLVTPSIPEATELTGCVIKNHHDMEKAAEKLIDRGAPAVLITGGHMQGPLSSDYFLAAGHGCWLDGIRHPYALHGAGDCITAAIVAGLARGWPLESAVMAAKTMLRKAAAAALPMGTGNRPVVQARLMYDSGAAPTT